MWTKNPNHPNKPTKKFKKKKCRVEDTDLTKVTQTQSKKKIMKFRSPKNKRRMKNYRWLVIQKQKVGGELEEGKPLEIQIPRRMMNVEREDKGRRGFCGEKEKLEWVRGAETMRERDERRRYWYILIKRGKPKKRQELLCVPGRGCHLRKKKGLSTATHHSEILWCSY